LYRYNAEAQMFRMTAVGPDGETPLPTHFIGRVESFEVDWVGLCTRNPVDPELESALVVSTLEPMK
jgi:hypothetical protein